MIVYLSQKIWASEPIYQQVMEIAARHGGCRTATISEAAGLELQALLKFLGHDHTRQECQLAFHFAGRSQQQRDLVAKSNGWKKSRAADDDSDEPRTYEGLPDSIEV